MKKITFLMLFALLSLSCSNETIQEQTNSNQQNSAVNDMAKIKIKGGSITLGIGRTSRDCRGFSICKIKNVSVTIDDYTITYTNQNRPSVQCNYTVIDKDNFYLLFDDSIITELVSIQGGYQFVMEESFTIDNSSSSIMGISEDFTISEGTFPITYDSKENIYKVLMSNTNI